MGPRADRLARPPADPASVAADGDASTDDLENYEPPADDMDNYEPPADDYDPAMDADYGYQRANGLPGGRGNPRLTQEDILKALLNGLAANGTPQAWQAVERLLKGEVKAGLPDEIVVDLVLAALFENYGGPEHPAANLLQTALAAPDKLRSGTAAGVSASVLQQKVIALHTDYAVSALDALLGVTGPEQEAGRLPGRGGAPGGYNRAGPAGNEEGEVYEPPMESDTGYDEYAGGAGGRGRPPGNRSGGPAAQQPAASAPPITVNLRSLDAGEAKRVLAYLARPDFVNTVESQLRALSNLTDGTAGKQLALAGSLPADSLRAAACEALQAHWEQGADVLTSQQVFERVVRDPGMLLVLKTLPQISQMPTRRPATSRMEEENRAKFSWGSATRDLVRALNARMFAAAANRGGTSGEAPPLRLHDGGVISAEYRFSWPLDVGGPPPDALAAPLNVTYLRVDAGQANARQILSHYERQIRGGKASFANNNYEAWIESHTAGEQPGTRRSLDVMLTITGGAGGGPAGSGDGERLQNMIVEVLVVEGPDPKLAATKDVAQAQ